MPSTTPLDSALYVSVHAIGVGLPPQARTSSISSFEVVVRYLIPFTAPGAGVLRTRFHSSRYPPEPTGGSTLSGVFASNFAACARHRSDRASFRNMSQLVM